MCWAVSDETSNLTEDLVGAREMEVAIIVTSFMNQVGGLEVSLCPTMDSGRNSWGRTNNYVAHLVYLDPRGWPLLQPSFVSGRGHNSQLIGYLGIDALGGCKADLFQFGASDSFSRALPSSLRLCLVASMLCLGL